MPGKIFVGTASWTDPGFIADWYPKGLPASERLSWYAGHFNFVELNSSFYSIPEHKQVERWCQQTPADFVFDVKLHRLLSRHSTKPEMLPRDLRTRAGTKNGKVLLTPDLEQGVAIRLLDEIKPFSDAGKLGALLLQLSPSFSPRRHQLSELLPLLDRLAGYAVAVELRQRDWVTGDQLQETVEYFRKRKVTLVSVDTPQEAHFMIMPNLDAVTNPQLAYLRAHGRNAKGYISGRSVAERFSHQYADNELEEIAGRAATLAEQTAQLHVVFNNNDSDYAPKDAARFRELFAQKFPKLAEQLWFPVKEKGAGRAAKQQTFSFGRS